MVRSLRQRTLRLWCMNLLVALGLLLAACDGLTQRFDGLFAGEARVADASSPVSRSKAEASRLTRPQPSLRLQAAPVVLDGALRCVLAVSLPLQVGMARYRTSVDKTEFQNGRRIVPPPDLQVTIETCLRDLDAQVHADCGADLATARDDYSAALSDLAPVLASLSDYYRGLRYMDDGMRESIALNQRCQDKFEIFARRDRVLRTRLRLALWQDWQKRAKSVRNRPRQRLTWQVAALLLASLELAEPLLQGDRVSAKNLLVALRVRARAFEVFVLKDLNRDRVPAEQQAAARRLGALAVRLRQQARRMLGENAASHAATQAVEKTSFEIARVAAELR